MTENDIQGYFAPNKSERDAVPVFAQCSICGSLAEMHGGLFQCQKNPGHIADTMTGIFSDRSWPQFSGDKK